MNKLIPTLFLGLSLTAAHADEQSHKAENIGIASGAVIGATAAGPVGAVVGALIGVHYASSVKQASEVPGLQGDLATANSELRLSQTRIARLDRSLFETRGELAKLGEEMSELLLERAVFEGLQMEVMYPTAASELSPESTARIERLAELLHKVPEITVRLDGYADPRGADGYNLDLSRERAETVRDILTAAGIEPTRVSIYAHGETTSASGEDDLDAYALDRRVRIRLFGTTGTDSAQVARQD